MYCRAIKSKSNSIRAAAARRACRGKGAGPTEGRAVAQLHSAGSGVIQMRDHHYWYRTARHGPWIYAGSFKNHATANRWHRANRAALGIVQFGEGNSAHSYR